MLKVQECHIGWYSLVVILGFIRRGRKLKPRLVDIQGTTTKDTVRSTKPKKRCVSFMKIDTTVTALDVTKPRIKQVLVLLLRQGHWMIKSHWSARPIFELWALF